MNKLNTSIVALFGILSHQFKMASTTTASLHNLTKTEYQGGVKRFPVPDDKLDWSVEWPEYAPVDYTAPSVAKGPVWADPEIRSASIVYHVLC